MPIPFLAITAIAAAVQKWGPVAVKAFNAGKAVAKAISEGREELTDEEWAEIVKEGDETDEEFKKLVGRD